MRNPVHLAPKGGPLLTTLAAGVLAGWSSGQVLLLLGLIREWSIFFSSSPSWGHAAWIIVRSIGVYGLLGAVTGSLAALILHLVLPRSRHSPKAVLAAVLGLGVMAVVLLELVAWRQITYLAGLALSDGSRIRWFVRDLLYSGGAGLAASLLLWFALKFASLRRMRLAAGGVVLLAALLMALSSLGLRPGQPALQEGAWRPSQVVVAGVDAISFRVLGPMMERGRVPTFRRLVREGAWGTLMTYGSPSSPMGPGITESTASFAFARERRPPSPSRARTDRSRPSGTSSPSSACESASSTGGSPILRNMSTGFS
jgi:hypothetical protein